MNDALAQTIVGTLFLSAISLVIVCAIIWYEKNRYIKYPYRATWCAEEFIKEANARYQSRKRREYVRGLVKGENR